jgi:vacuolar protein sorting-associated protein 29
MTSFGELVLIVGDYHIPSRATRIPPAFQRMMMIPNRMQHVVCTGNLGSGAPFDELQSLVPSPKNLHAVMGQFDHDAVAAGLLPSLPESTTFSVGKFTIGVIHGHQPHASFMDSNSAINESERKHALSRLRRKMSNVDILVRGSSHRNEVLAVEDGDDRFYYINPVSLKIAPQFMLS